MTEKEIKELERKANKGDKDAREELCSYYNSEVDYDVAKKWFKKAAENGWAEAQYMMADEGYYYDRNLTEEENKKLRFKWMKKAAEQGYSSAQVGLGECYSFGWGTEENRREAFKWYKKSAEQGNAAGQYELAECYSCGLGVTKNATEAVRWYREASAQGWSSAKTELGFCYERGFGVQENYNKALALYKEAISDNDSWAYYRLGMCYLKGCGVEKDIDEAKYWLGQAADRGVKSAKEQLEKINSDCFITTAVCSNLYASDNCYELNMFRNFRDTWLNNCIDGRKLINRYYEIAPKIVHAINSKKNKEDIYLMIWNDYLKPCLKFIEDSEFEKCKEKYVSMVRKLEETYLR